MKITLRILALSLVVAGFAAAASTPRSAKIVPSHQSATAKMPIPACSPQVPCDPNDPDDNIQ